MLESLAGDVIRHAKTVLIRRKGDDKKVFMWNVYIIFQTPVNNDN